MTNIPGFHYHSHLQSYLFALAPLRCSLWAAPVTCSAYKASGRTWTLESTHGLQESVKLLKMACFSYPRDNNFLISQFYSLKLLFINISEHLRCHLRKQSIWSILQLECAQKSHGDLEKPESGSESQKEILLCRLISFQMTPGLLETTV